MPRTWYTRDSRGVPVKTSFGNVVVSGSVPENEVWLVTPGEQIQVLRPCEPAYDYKFEDNKLICRRNGVVIDVVKPQVHKITNIGE
jgi:hypothetical protein